MNIKVKLCGFTNKETLDVASSSGADFIGFIFHKKSPRYIDPKKAREISSSLPKNIKKVAVITDATNDEIKEIIFYLRPDFLQIHGAQSAARIKEIRTLFNIPIIRAIKLTSKEDLKKIKEFQEVADYFLFDGSDGGSGKSFDWKILQDLALDKKWFLSGGLNIHNIEEAIKISGAKIIDLSSGIEEIRGVKSARLIKKFMEKVKNI